jgi:hypothetical protein
MVAADYYAESLRLCPNSHLFSVKYSKSKKNYLISGLSNENVNAM